MSIQKDVIKIIATQFDISEDQITRETKFTEDLKAKSIQIIEMCAVMEDHFNIKINMEEARKNETVDKTIDYIEELIKKS